MTKIVNLSLRIWKLRTSCVDRPQQNGRAKESTKIFLRRLGLLDFKQGFKFSTGVTVCCVKYTSQIGFQSLVCIIRQPMRYSLKLILCIIIRKSLVFLPWSVILVEVEINLMPEESHVCS